MNYIQNKNFIKIAGSNFKVILSNRGASIYDIVFDKKHMVVNYFNKSKHLENNPYFFGKTVGRIGGRVTDCKLTFKGKTYNVKANEGKNSLHGGGYTIHTYDFSSDVKTLKDKIVVEFKTRDIDGSNGYPGNVDIVVRYTISESGSILIEFESKADQDTPINLINHNYYNIDGEPTILKQILKGDLAGCYFARPDTIADTTKVQKFKELDFKKGVVLGDLINNKFFQEFNQKGIDHCFIFNGDEKKLQLISKLHTMTIETDYPRFQMYSYNSVQSSKIFLNTFRFERLKSGIAIEPQEIPGDYESMISKKDEWKKRWMKITINRN